MSALVTPSIPIETIEIGTHSYSAHIHENVSVVIVKVTHRCNLSCDYCYENITAGEDMSLETFKTIVREVLHGSRNKLITFVLHGGEPTLMGEDWLRSAVNYARYEADQIGKTVKIGMQSNVISLASDKIELVKELGIRLSVSMDGPSQTPMRGRLDRTLENYLQAKGMGVHAGVLMTINHSNFDSWKDICKWLLNDVGATSFKANVVYSVGYGKNLPDLSPEKILKAQIDIVEYMIQNDATIIEDNLASEVLKFLSQHDQDFFAHLTSRGSVCRVKSCGAGKQVIGVTPQGHILPCGRFQWDDEEYFLGSVVDKKSSDPDLEIFKRAVDSFHSQESDNWSDCNTCEAQDICNYGCQAFISRSSSKKNIECIPTKLRFQYYQQNVDRLLSIKDRLKAWVESSNMEIGEFLYDDDNKPPSYDDYYVDYADTYYDKRD